MEYDYTSIEDYLSNEVYVTETSEFDDRLRVAPALPEATRADPLEQLIFFYTYNVVIVAVGIILNLVLIRGISCAKSTGALLFVLQIAIVDVLTLLTSDWELYYHLTRTWTLPPEQCMLYSGFESLTSVAIAYLIVGLNFHSIATYNLAVEVAKGGAIAATEPESVADSFAEENSYEVATDALAQKRSLTIDYRYKKTRISVLFPILLVWFIAVSESLPLFLFSDIVLEAPTMAAVAGRGGGNGTQHCTVLVNAVTNHRLVSLMVILIRIVLPTVALLITTVQIVVKFYRGKRFAQPDEIDENVAFALKLSMFLSISYVLFTAQRLYGSLLLEILSEPNVVPKYPQFSSTIGLSLAVFHYCASFIRPLVIVAMCKQRNNHVDITFLCRKRSANDAISLE
uniref:G-protein coupled receptors family 1 profile domain-containing protein n=1 Tax=Anopheles atroparvus TaxID=41427 RepID=A0AAG5DVN7_ANOAO